MNQGQIVLWKPSHGLVGAFKKLGGTRSYEIPCGLHVPAGVFENMISCQDKPLLVNDCSSANRNLRRFLLTLLLMES